MKPKPGVIELEATEIESASPAEETASAAEADAAADLPFGESTPEDVAGESAPEAAGPSSSPRPAASAQRMPLGTILTAGIAGGALSLIAAALLVSSGLVPLGGDAGLSERMAGIESALKELRSAPPQEDALKSDITRLKVDIAALRAAPPPAVTDPAVETRLAEIGARLDELSKSAPDNSANAVVENLSARIDDIAAKLAAAPPPAIEQAVAGAKSAAALAAVASLESAVARGVPYADALAGVRNRLPDASVAALEADAERGMPPAALLAERLKAKLDQAPAPESKATNLVDRLKEGAFGLVRVRPVDGSVPVASVDDPWSVRNAVTVRLGQRDYAAALVDWDKLDSAAQDATKEEAAALKARLAADAALDNLRAVALSQTGAAN